MYWPCDAFYIGESSREISTLVKENLRYTKNRLIILYYLKDSQLNGQEQSVSFSITIINKKEGFTTFQTRIFYPSHYVWFYSYFPPLSFIKIQLHVFTSQIARFPIIQHARRNTQIFLIQIILTGVTCHWLDLTCFLIDLTKCYCFAPLYYLNLSECNLFTYSLKEWATKSHKTSENSRTWFFLSYKYSIFIDIKLPNAQPIQNYLVNFVTDVYLFIYLNTLSLAQRGTR